MDGRWVRNTKAPQYSQRCSYLKRLPTHEDCLGCQRPGCVHDGEDGRRANKGRPRQAKAGAVWVS